MEWHFALPGSPGSTCRLQKTFWLGRLHVFYRGRPVARSKERGKPFLVPLPDGRTARVVAKGNGLDYLPKLEVDGHPVLLGRPLSSLEYALGGLPLVLMFVGGALGGLAGGLGALCNYRLLRTERAQTVKVLGVIGVTAASAFTYVVLAGLAHVILSR